MPKSNEDVHEAVEAALRNAPESAIAAAGVIAVSWPIAVSNDEAGSITVYNIVHGNECGEVNCATLAAPA